MTFPYQLFSINDIISISGGSPVHQVSGSISSVVIDSREVSRVLSLLHLKGRELTDIDISQRLLKEELYAFWRINPKRLCFLILGTEQ